MKNKRIVFLIILIILIAIGLFIFFSNNGTKNFKIGNNTSSQGIVDYILKINSYEAIIEVDVKSNKNENKYKIKQVYNGKDNNSQEVLEPGNIAGVKLIKDEAVVIMKKELLPLSDLITPNILELEILSDTKIKGIDDMISASKKISEEFGCAVLCKGGHGINDGEDLLYNKNGVKWYKTKKLKLIIYMELDALFQVLLHHF